MSASTKDGHAIMYDENSNASVVASSTVSGLAGSQTGLPLAGLPSLPSSASTLPSTPSPSTALVSQLLNVKDSRWLQVEVCREFQRGQCARSGQECKFAHPPPHVDVQQGRVTACYDSIKGRCTRENPKCKYLHPPQHIKDQLLINGRNNLALKNMLCSQLGSQGALPTPQLAQHQQQAASLVAPVQYPFYSPVMYSPLLSDPYQAQLHALGLQQLGLGLQLPSLLPFHAPAAAPSAPSTAASVAQQLAAASRKRALDEETSAQQDASSFINLAAAAAAQVAVPSKRPAMDNKGAGGGMAVFPQQAYNPYLLQAAGIQNYVPAVSFSGGQLPPRY